MKKIYIWIDKLNRHFWERVVDSTYLGAKSLSAFRILLGLFLLATYMPDFSWIAKVPQTFFNPPVFSLANIFDSFPGETFFSTLDYLVLLSLVCLTIGVKARVFTLVYLVSCLVGLHFQYSFGKIHHMILPYAMLGCMAFSGWGRYLAILPDRKSGFDHTSKSLSLLSVLVCFAFFTAGFGKAFVWLDFDISLNGFLGWSQFGIFNDYRHYLLAPYVKHIPVILLELFDYSAVIFELSPLLFLLHSRKGWRLWLLIACIFHFSNTLLLNIPFTLHSMVYLVFIDFTWLYRKLEYSLSLFNFKCMAAGLVILIILVRSIPLFDFSIFLTPNELTELNLYFSLVVWGLAIVVVARSVMNRKIIGKVTIMAKTYRNYQT